jgi:predicted MFS family arabinose efflux permease
LSAAGRVPRLWWAVLGGNFAIGCGVMVVAGALNDLVRDLSVSVAVGGQLVAVSALVMGVGAPLAAALSGSWDRRRLLTLSLAGYAVGHALAALMPSYAALLPVRALSVLGAAVFTPQAAAVLSVLAPPDQRGRAIAFAFLGWSLASVVGLPMASWVSEVASWRWAFALVAGLSALAAVVVWRTMPAGVKAAPLSLASWGQVFTSPPLMAIVAVTACSAAGQFSLMTYFAPYFLRVLGATAGQTSAMFLLFGCFAMVGVLLTGRYVDRLGAARTVSLGLAAITLSLALWPLALGVASMAMVLVPWALGCFSSNSAQQARLGAAAPALAGALLSLNTSAIYLGQAVGAAGGGALIAARGFDASLSWFALAWLLLALALSLWAARAMHRQRTASGAA